MLLLPETLPVCLSSGRPLHHLVITVGGRSPWPPRATDQGAACHSSPPIVHKAWLTLPHCDHYTIDHESTDLTILP